MKVFLTLILVFLCLSLSGCKDLPHWFDGHLQKKLISKGFFAHSYKTDTSQLFFYDNEKHNAPILLLIHGFGGDGKMTWNEQMSYFGKNYRVIVPDLLWFGNSNSNTKASLITQVKMIKSLVNHLKLHRFHIIGISYGGFVSLGYAQMFPKDLFSLTIVDSPGPCISDEDIVQLCSRFGVDSLQDAFVPQTVQGVQRLIALSFNKKPFIPRSVAKQAIGFFVSKYPKKQKLLIQDLLKRRTFFHPSEINVPSLILWGKNDSIFLAKQAFLLQKKLKSKLIIVPKAGHMLPKDQGKAFNNAVDTFVKSISEL